MSRFTPGMILLCDESVINIPGVDSLVIRLFRSFLVKPYPVMTFRGEGGWKEKKKREKRIEYYKTR